VPGPRTLLLILIVSCFVRSSPLFADDYCAAVLAKAVEAYPAKKEKSDTLLEKWGGEYPLHDIGFVRPDALYSATHQVIGYHLSKDLRYVLSPSEKVGKNHPLTPALIHPKFRAEFEKLKALGFTVVLDASLSGLAAYQQGRFIYMSADANWATFLHEAQHALFEKFLSSTSFDFSYVARRLRDDPVEAAKEFKLTEWKARGLEVDAMVKGIQASLTRSGVHEMMAGSAGIRALGGNGIGVVFAGSKKWVERQHAIDYRNTYVKRDLESVPEAKRTPLQRELLEEVMQRETWHHKARQGFFEALPAMKTIAAVTGLLLLANEGAAEGKTGDIVKQCLKAEGEIGWESLVNRPVCYCSGPSISFPLDLVGRVSCSGVKTHFTDLTNAMAENDSHKIIVAVDNIIFTAHRDSRSGVREHFRKMLAADSRPQLQRVAFDIGYDDGGQNNPWTLAVADSWRKIARENSKSNPLLSTANFRDELAKSEGNVLLSLDDNDRREQNPPEFLHEVLTGPSPAAKLVLLRREIRRSEAEPSAFLKSLSDDSEPVRREAAYQLNKHYANFAEKNTSGLLAAGRASKDPVVRELIEDFERKLRPSTK